MKTEIREAHPEELCELFALRWQVLSRLGWIDRQEYPGRLESDVDDRHSIHFIARHDGRTVGTLRLVHPGPENRPLPIERAFGRPAAEELGLVNGTRPVPVEVSRFMVEPHDGLPRHALSLGLLQVVIRRGVDLGVTHWYQALDRVVFRLVQSWGFHFVQYAASKEYLGSLTIPTYLPVERFFEDQRRESAAMYRLFATDFSADQIAPEAAEAFRARREQHGRARQRSWQAGFESPLQHP
jgi:N-acyl-L-homoserine lactone synthetase